MHADFPVAHDLPDHLPWLNTDSPLSLHGELWGHVVVLCFWNASDVHALRTMEELQEMAGEFADRAVAVLGVHTAKFAFDRDEHAVREALVQHDLRLPVLVDESRGVWAEYECQAWPTLVVIDAEGAIRFRGAGEIDRIRLARAVEALLEDAEQRAMLAGAYLTPLAPPAAPRPGALAFPAGLAFDPESGWLWVADSGHHRLLAVAPETGVVQREVGAGAPGAADGAGAVAAFRGPRGLAVEDNTLLVADRGNHRLRAVDLRDAALAVRTVVDRDHGLHSPCGVCAHDGRIYLAAAGNHQVWLVDPERGAATPWAGNGQASARDGARETATLAAPWAVAVDAQGDVGIVDAQASALRVLAAADDALHTRVGGGLFAFGDADGPAGEARLQLPTALCAGEDAWLVADTGNHKVRRVCRESFAVTTLVGPDTGLRRPEGLALRGRELWIASAGTHALACLDLDSGVLREVEVVPPQG